MLTKDQIKSFMTAMKLNGDKRPSDVTYENIKIFADTQKVDIKDVLEFVEACGDKELKVENKKVEKSMNCGDGSRSAVEMSDEEFATTDYRKLVLNLKKKYPKNWDRINDIPKKFKIDEIETWTRDQEDQVLKELKIYVDNKRDFEQIASLLFGLSLEPDDLKEYFSDSVCPKCGKENCECSDNENNFSEDNEPLILKSDDNCKTKNEKFADDCFASPEFESLVRRMIAIKKEMSEAKEEAVKVSLRNELSDIIGKFEAMPYFAGNEAPSKVEEVSKTEDKEVVIEEPKKVEDKKPEIKEEEKKVEVKKVEDKPVLPPKKEEVKKPAVKEDQFSYLDDLINSVQG